MAIIFSEDGKNTEKLEESKFEIEDKLQSYIYDNPDAIPLYDINEDTRLFIAAREFTTRSGPIDALGFDEAGNIYIIETKLFKNPDKRTVIAQALDYGASLWKHSANFEEFESQLNAKCHKYFAMNFIDKYKEFFGLDDVTDSIENIRQNLEDGVIKYVVLMDKLHDALKDLIVYVNQNSKFDIYAVELEYYKHKKFEIVIPKLYGAEVKKDIKTKSSSRSETIDCDEDTFLEYLKKGDFNASAVNINQALKIHELNKKMLQKTGGKVQYCIVKRPGGDRAQSFYIDDKYNFEFETDCTLSFFPYDKNTAMVNLTRELYRQVVEQELFGKGNTKLNSPRYFITANQMNNPKDIEKFLKIYEQLIS